MPVTSKRAIKNSGKGTARDLNILFDGGLGLREHPAIMKSYDHPLHEVHELAPNEVARYDLDLQGDALAKRILVTWTEDSGQGGRFESALMDRTA